MTIKTDYYGEVEYLKEDLVTFPDGFLGFPDLKQYLPLSLSEDDDSMILMQSTERPEVAFVVINPLFLCPDYSPILTTEELSCLGVSSSIELSYYVICVLRDNYLENTVNLKCPLAINPDTRIGIQVIMENTNYGYRHQLSSFPSILNGSVKANDRGEKHVGTQKEKE